MGSRQESLSQALSSAEGLHALLKPGNRLVIVLPQGGTLMRAFNAALVHTLPHPLKSAVLTGDSDPQVSSTRVVSVADTKNINEALSRVRRHAAVHTLVVTGSSPFGSWDKKPLHLYDFYRKATRTLARSRARSIWLFEQERLSDELWAEIKEDAEFFATAFSSGPLTLFQFLTAKGFFSPWLFLPRRLTIEGNTIRIEEPSVPVPAAQGQTVDLLQEPYRRAFGAAGDGIVLFDWKGTYREPNERACEILGYSETELRSIPLRDLVAPSSYRSVLRALLLVKRKGRTSLDVHCRRKSGRIVTLAVSASNSGYGQLTALLRDVTAERREQASLRGDHEALRRRVDAVPYPQALFTGRRLSSANRALRAMFPWAVSGDETPTILQFFGKHNQDVGHALVRLLEQYEPPFVEKRSVRLRAPDGTSMDVDLTVEATTSDGTTETCLTFVDTTGFHDAIRQHEDAVLNFKALVDSSAVALAVIRDGRYLFVNRGFLDMLGYATADELHGHEFSASVASRDRKSVLNKLGAAVPAPGEVLSFEFSALRKEGSQTRIDATCASVDHEGQPALLLSCRDVGGTLKSTEELRRRLDDGELLGRIEDSVRYLLDPVSVASAALDASLKALGFEAGGMYLTGADRTALTFSDQRNLSENILRALSVQSTQEGVTGFIARTLEPQVLSIQNYPPHLPYKSLFEAEHVGTVTYIPCVAGEALEGILLLCSTRRLDPEDFGRILLPSIGKMLGAALRNATVHHQTAESEHRFRSAFEGVPDTVYVASPTGAFLLLSPQVEALSGFKVADFLGNPELWRNLLHPDDRAKYSERISNQHAGAERYELFYRFLPKGKAAYRWIRDAYRYVRDGNGTVLSIDGTLSDVTERMEQGAETAASAALTQDVLESVQEGVLVLDRELQFLVWNSAMVELTGVQRGDVIGKRTSELPVGHPMGAMLRLFELALKGDQVSQDDLSFIRGGETRYMWCRCSPLRDANGVIVGAAGTVTDVTGRRNLEHELRESEETLRNVIDGMGDALMISDLQGKIWEVNREFSHITGYPRGEVLRMDFPYPWVVDEEMANFVAWITALREKQSLRDFDMTWKRKDGRKVSISLSTTLLRTATGEPMAMLNLARDISERKQLANELSAKNRQIEMLNRIISKANTTVDFATIFDIIAVEVLNLLTYDLIAVSLLTEDGQNVRLFACMSPGKSDIPVGEVVPLDRSISGVAIAAKEPIVVADLSSDHRFAADLWPPLTEFKSLISIPIVLNDRVLGAFNVAADTENEYTGSELAILQPIADQIGALIDRTLLFQRVSDDSKYIHTLLNSIDSVVVTVDPGLHIREANKAWREFARLLGEDDLKEEASIIGQRAEEILRIPQVWEDLHQVVPRLLEQSLDYVTREFNLEGKETTRTFQLTVTPMLIGEKVTGLVFTITDITESKKTEAEIKQRNRELLALNAVNTSITKSLNIDEVLSVALDAIRDISGAELVLCYLRDAQAGNLRLARSVGLPEDLAAHVRVLDESTSAFGGVIAGRHLLLIRDHPSQDLRLTAAGRNVLEALAMQSFMAFPLLSKERVLGTLGIGFGRGRPFTDQEQSFLLLIGSQLGAAIENAQLYAEIQAQVQRITSLYELGKGLSGAIDTRSLLDVVRGETAKAISFDLFAYDLYHEDTEQFERVFAVGPDTGNISGQTDLELPESIRAVVLRRVSYIGDTEETGSVLAVPVLSKEKILGILSVSKRPKHSYDQTHLRLLESIANMTGIAVDRAVLYEDTVAKSLEIENRNKELDDFTYVVSHDLKEPLITIEGYSKIVLKDYQEKIDEEGRGYLTAVVHSTSRMKSLIDDLLTLSRLGRLVAAPRLVSVKAILADVLHDFEFTLREKNAVVSVPDGLPEVTYDGTQLGMVFRNLISNAIKFNPGPEPRVQVGMKEEDNEFVFSVADNGIGIEKQHFDKIFIIFQRLHRSEEYQGTGAGLTIVKRIVERHHGRIWVESEVGEGATFYFTVPK
jgi:PAS domain S-box-containing protein